MEVCSASIYREDHSEECDAQTVDDCFSVATYYPSCVLFDRMD